VRRSIEVETSAAGDNPEGAPLQSRLFIDLAIKPTIPSRNNITEMTKIIPWIIITQAPNPAR
jgi:hypothetical protein